MGIVNDQVRLHNGGIEGLGRIRHLGQMPPPNAFPVGETIGAVAGTGLILGGVVVGNKAGTVMGIVGGVAVLTSGVLLIIKLTKSTGAAAPAPAPGAPAPAPAPPPPPSAPKPTSYEKIMSYATQYAPAINQLFSKLFGANRQPAMMVVR